MGATGFVQEDASDLLGQPEDDRTKPFLDETSGGRSDRFRKPAG